MKNKRANLISFKLAVFAFQAFLLSLFVFSLSGCLPVNQLKVGIKKTKSVKADLNISVSNVQIINNQFVFTGTNLNSATSLSYNDGSGVVNLQIESKTATSVVANSLSNVSLAAGKIFNFLISTADASSTFVVDFSLCNSTLGGKAIDCTVVPLDKQVLSYDQASGKWKPRDVNGLTYIGAFDASTGANPTIKPAGQYYIISVAGDMNAGATVLGIGDWIVSNGTIWEKIENSNVITTVHGRTGTVVGAEGDYSLTQISDVTITTPATNDVLKFNGTTWVNSSLSALGGGTVTNVSATAPLSVTNGTSTPAITISQASTSSNGYLTSTDWNTFNNKQASITASGSGALDYYGGDKAFHTLNTTAVAEGSNLYFTNARVLGLALTGFTDASASAITATDTILVALGKAQGQINGLTAGGTGYVATAGGSILAGTTTVSGVIDATTSGDIRVGSPSAGSSATSKTYVDNANLLKLNKAGDSMSGLLTLDADLKIKGTTNYVTLKANTATSTYNFSFPVDGGTNGYVLSTNGSGVTSWIPVAAAPVTSVNTLTGAVVLTTSNIAEGSNLYHTDARTLAAPITAPTLTNSAIATSDTIQVALGKLQGQFNNVLSLAITGYAAGSNAVLSATDTILAAFGKLQGQISANTTNISTKADLTNGAQSITASNITTTTINGSPFVNGNWTTSGSDVYRSSGNVGVGTTSPLYKLHTDDTQSNPSSSMASVRAATVPTISANNSQTANGIYASVAPIISTGVTASGEYATVRASGTISSASNLGTINNFSASKLTYGITSAGAGNIVNAYGVRVQPQHAAGSISNSYGIKLESPVTGGTVTNEWGVYQESTTAKNHFSGNIGIGTTNPASKVNILDTSGNSPIQLITSGALVSDSLYMTVNGRARFGYDGGRAAVSISDYSPAGATANKSIVFDTNASERMRIDTSGFVGIGTNAPLSTLDVRGNVNVGTTTSGSYISQNAQDGYRDSLRISRGSGAYSIGMSSGGTDLQFGAGGTLNDGNAKVAFTAAGNVGIGTISPGNKLHVLNNTGFGSVMTVQTQTASEPALGMQSVSKPAGLQVIGGDQNDNAPGLIAVISPSLGAYSARGPGLNFASTRSTTTQLSSGTYTALQASDAIGSIIFGGDNGVNLRAMGATISGYASGGWTSTSLPTDIAFSTTASGSTTLSERMKIASSGNVGVGVTSPTAKLQVQADGNATSPILLAGNATAGASNTAMIALTSDASGGSIFTTSSNYTDNASFDPSPVARALYLRSSSAATGGIQLLTGNGSADIVFKPNGAETMRVRVGGNIGIGVAAPANKLEVAGTILSTTGAIGTKLISASTGVDTNRAYLDNSGYIWSTMDSAAVSSNLYLNRNNTSNPFISFYYGSSNIGSVSTNGSSVAFNTTSDYRLKENISDLENAIDRVLKIKAHRFNYISSPNQTMDGFIAHELAAVVPEAVTGKKDAVDKNGKIIPQLVDYSKVVPVVTGAIKEFAEIFNVANAPKNHPSLTVDKNGNVGIGTNTPSFALQVNGAVAGSSAYSNLSDSRLKKDITKIPDALFKLTSIDGVYYHFRTNDFPDKNLSNRREMGVTAQSVQKVFPEAVTKDKEGYLSIAYSMLIGPIIEAIKEIDLRFNNLVKKVESNSRAIASKIDKVEFINFSENTDSKIKKLEAENVKLKKENEAVKAYICSKDRGAAFCR